MKPSDDALTLVHGWLEDNKIATADLEYSPAKDWIKISLPVKDIETLLDTKYSIFAHDDGNFLVRTPEWSLPLHLHEHIEVIQPTNSFFRPRQQATTVKTVDDIFDVHAHPAPPVYTPPTDPSIAAVCNTSLVTPLCLRTLYGTVEYVPKVAGKNKVGLNDFLGESNNRSDTSIFLKAYRPEAAAAAYEFQVKMIANGNNEQTQENSTELAAGKDLEGNLDVEAIIGIDWPTPLIAYTTGGSPPFNPDLNTPTNTNEPYLVSLSIFFLFLGAVNVLVFLEHSPSLLETIKRVLTPLSDMAQLRPSTERHPASDLYLICGRRTDNPIFIRQISLQRLCAARCSRNFLILRLRRFGSWIGWNMLHQRREEHKYILSNVSDNLYVATQHHLSSDLDLLGLESPTIPGTLRIQPWSFWKGIKEEC